MQRRLHPKSRTPVQTKRKGSPPKPRSPPKAHQKMKKGMLTGERQTGSKRSIPRKSCKNSLFHSVGELPLQNVELKQRLLQQAIRGEKCSSANEQSLYTRTQRHYPNGEYFGSSHSFLPYLENSKQSGGSKNSKKSKNSSKSKSASLIEQKMKAYRALQTKHSRQFQKILGASPKQVRRLQKMHSLQRLHAMEELARVGMNL